MASNPILEVLEADGSDNETASRIRIAMPDSASEEVRSRIKRDVGDYLVEAVRQAVAEQSTPVNGESWKPKLSPEYEKTKKKMGLPPVPNMEQSGEMMDALRFKETVDGIDIGFFDDNAAKADGHLHFSVESADATA